MRFGWDDPKHQRNIRERAFGFDRATRVFESRTIVWVDDRFAYGETRMRALGEVDGELLHVVYTDRGDIRWIISARRASRKERRSWRYTP
ncbi:MAG: BrnT family toxin [Rhizobiales bacterium]|nr:BrnT family toxin [Hyphomicrobiales bacterium]